MSTQKNKLTTEMHKIKVDTHFKMNYSVFQIPVVIYPQ